MGENDSIHKGHRDRLRDRLLKQGADSLQPHELLELFLYAYIPRKDTNVIAHNLIQTFGSISAVVDAEIEDLAMVKDMTYNAAVAIHTVPFLIKIYLKDKQVPKKNLSSIVNAVDYIKSEAKFLTKEQLFILCLDTHYNLIKSVVIKSNFVDRVNVSMKDVHSAVLRHKSKYIIIAHNHPCGSLLPSDDDINLTRDLLISMSFIDISVLDHIIVTANNHFSFRERGLLYELMPGDEIKEVRKAAEKVYSGVNYIDED